MQIEIFEVNGGFGYRIVDKTRNIHIEQPFKPDVENFQPMTQEEAEQIASTVMDKLTEQEETTAQ